MIQIGQVSAGGYFQLFWKFQTPLDFVFSRHQGRCRWRRSWCSSASTTATTPRGGPVGVGHAPPRKSMVVNILGIHVIGLLGTQLFWGGNPRAPDRRMRRRDGHARTGGWRSRRSSLAIAVVSLVLARRRRRLRGRARSSPTPASWSRAHLVAGRRAHGRRRSPTIRLTDERPGRGRDDDLDDDAPAAAPRHARADPHRSACRASPTASWTCAPGPPSAPEIPDGGVLAARPHARDRRPRRAAQRPRPGRRAATSRASLRFGDRAFAGTRPAGQRRRCATSTRRSARPPRSTAS